MAMNSNRYIILLVLLAIACACTFFSENADQEDFFRQILTGIGILNIIAWVFLIKIQMNPARKNLVANILLLNMAFLLLLIANMVADRFNHRIDITTSQEHSLSQQSKEILKDLQEPIEIKAFFLSASPEEKRFRMLIDAFTEQTPLLTVAFHDPNKEPMLARQHDVQQLAEIIIQKDDQTQRLDSVFTEEALIQVILSLSQGRSHEICFSTGHQELIADQYEPLRSMQNILNKLEAQNYTGRNINLMQKQSIPTTCSVFVIAGPQLDFAPFEIAIIAEYVASGGNLYTLVDVGKTPALCASFAQYGIIIKDNVILEPNPKQQISGGDLSYAVLNTTDFAIHPTAKTLSINILMQDIRSVEIDESNQVQSVLELAQTSYESWAETEYQNGPIERTPNIDVLGPVSVLAIAEINDPQAISIGDTDPKTLHNLGKKAHSIEEHEIKREKGAKIIVVGSSSLVVDELTSRPDLGNLDLFLNGISWMVNETDQLFARARNTDTEPFLLSPQQLRFIILIALLLSPATLLFGAISTWYWKKKAIPKTHRS